MKKILVTGGYGLVGSAVVDALSQAYPNCLVWAPFSDSYDLTREDDVREAFRSLEKSGPEPIDAVVHCAARVGGIGRNLNTPYQQYVSNILMNTLVIAECVRRKIKNVIAFSSACAFPAVFPTMEEDLLHAGEPFPAHRSYAYAKRMVDIQMEAAMKEYPDCEFNFCSLIPGNLYGERDNFDLENGHVVPSLIRKAYDAAILSKDKGKLKVWGTGTATREFIYSKDLGKLIVKLLKLPRMPSKLLVTGQPSKIIDVATIIANYMGIQTELDTSKPDGQLVRIGNQARLNALFPDFKFTPLKTGLEETIKWYSKSYPNVRGVTNAKA